MSGPPMTVEESELMSLGHTLQGRRGSNPLRARFINFTIFRPYKKIWHAMKKLNAKIERAAEAYDDSASVKVIAREQSAPTHLEDPNSQSDIQRSVIRHQALERVTHLQRAPTQRPRPMRVQSSRETQLQAPQPRVDNEIAHEPLCRTRDQFPGILPAWDPVVFEDHPHPLAHHQIGQPQLIATINPVRLRIKRKAVVRSSQPVLSSIPEIAGLGLPGRAKTPLNPISNWLQPPIEPRGTTQHFQEEKTPENRSQEAPQDPEPWDEAYYRNHDIGAGFRGLQYQPYTGGFRDACCDTDFGPAPSVSSTARKRHGVVFKHFYPEPDWDEQVDMGRVKTHYSALDDCNDPALANSDPMFPNLEARERWETVPEAQSLPGVTHAKTASVDEAARKSPNDTLQPPAAQPAHLPHDSPASDSIRTRNFSKPVRVPSPNPLPWYSPWPSPAPLEVEEATPKPVKPGYYRTGSPIGGFNSFNPLRLSWSTSPVIMNDEHLFLYDRKEWKLLSKKTRLETRLWWWGLWALWCPWWLRGGYPKLWQSA